MKLRKLLTVGSVCLASFLGIAGIAHAQIEEPPEVYFDFENVAGDTVPDESGNNQDGEFHEDKGGGALTPSKQLVVPRKDRLRVGHLILMVAT